MIDRNRWTLHGLVRLVLVAVVATALALPALAVEVGETAPPFALAGQGDETYSLDEVRGDKKALLIFFRGLW